MNEQDKLEVINSLKEALEKLLAMEDISEEEKASRLKLAITLIKEKEINGRANR